MGMLDRVNAAVKKAFTIACRDYEKASSIGYLIYMNEEDARELYVQMNRQGSYAFEEFVEITTVRVDSRLARGLVEVEFQ
jgi:hypothetical protein